MAIAHFMTFLHAIMPQIAAITIRGTLVAVALGTPQVLPVANHIPVLLADLCIVAANVPVVFSDIVRVPPCITALGMSQRQA
jgi:hypothetical protein